jgi:hypothetical protein
MGLSEVFWIALIGTASGLLLKLSSMLFKSKCSECSCFGITIKRDVITEEREHEYDVEHRVEMKEEKI